MSNGNCILSNITLYNILFNDRTLNFVELLYCLYLGYIFGNEKQFLHTFECPLRTKKCVILVRGLSFIFITHKF